MSAAATPAPAPGVGGTRAPEKGLAMRIGELAARAGVSTRALRYYEQQGLLSSTRSAAGQRHYGDNEADRVAYIQALYRGGGMLAV